MTDYRDRQIELWLREELGGETPPNQVRSILEAAQHIRQSETAAAFPHNGQAVPQATPTNAESRQRQSAPSTLPARRLWLVAAVLLVSCGAVWWGSGRILWNRWKVSNSASEQWLSVSLVERDGIVLPSTADADFGTETPRLRDGWVLTRPESQSVLVAFDELKLHDARAVIRVGRVPDSYEVVFLAKQLLQSNYLESQEEFEMITNSRNWVTLVGFAVCMLSGEVTVGQEILTANTTGTNITVKDVFARFDTSGDGQLQMSECVCACSRKCDLNADGTVTRQEFRQAVQKLAGSESSYLQMVAAHGGVEKFYQLAKAGRFDHVADVSMDSVFTYLDKDQSGSLEAGECICKGSRMADADGDGLVSQNELTNVAIKHFGSEDKFLAFVRQAGGVQGFYKRILATQKRNKTTIGQVFNRFDRDMSGKLEAAEMIFPNAQQADLNGDGLISMKEMTQLAKKTFGTVAKFEAHVNEFESVDEFYQALVAAAS